MPVPPQFLILKTGSTVPSLLAQGEDFEDWFIAGCGLPAAQFQVCRLPQGEVPPAPDRLAGILITGSPANLTDLAAWNYVAADYLQAAAERRVPILGVCYGHQLLAWTFGGTVEFNSQGREIGTVTIATTAAAADDALLGALPARFKAQASHVQSVTVLPPGAVRLARNRCDGNHAYRLEEGIWGVQFHPEFSARVVREYITQRADVIAAEGLPVAELLTAIEETQGAAALLRRFADYCLARGV